MNASDLVKLLAAKHSGDVFVPECKDGPTQGSSHFRLDGWAMKRSWSNPLVIGYEIKKSRSDFLKDDKWHAYLPMCNQLYFVCPHGLIEATEVPAEVGLLWAAKTGTRLYTKAKAAYRDVEIPETVWRYILMCRAVITREYEAGNGNREFWEEWLTHKKLDYRFGARVSKEIRRRVDEEIEAVRTENARLSDLVETYAEIAEMLKEMDISPRRWSVKREVKQQIENARSAIPATLSSDLEAVSKSVQQAQASLALLESAR